MVEKVNDDISSGDVAVEDIEDKTESEIGSKKLKVDLNCLKHNNELSPEKFQSVARLTDCPTVDGTAGGDALVRSLIVCRAIKLALAQRRQLRRLPSPGQPPLL